MKAANRWTLCTVTLALALVLPQFANPRHAVAQPHQTVQASAQNVVRATLGNGLRVVIVRNDLAPVVATSLNYLVGADETPPGFPGTAHAQEHMMFRGSPGLSADQLANIGSILGGRFNADTRQSVTQYFYTVPSDDLEIALHIEALRMRAVTDSAQDWREERGAIEQEVAQDLSNPEYMLASRLRTALFKGTPYEHDALGTRPSFDRTTAAMLKSFHDRWYAPNNAVLVVVGDLDPDATLAKIRTLFEPIAARPLPPRRALKLAPVRPQTLNVESDLPDARLSIALRLPGLDSPDYPALELLSDVLSSQRGALYDLVPQGKALAASFSYEPLPKAGIGTVDLDFPAHGDAAALEHEVRAILARIAEEGVPTELVEAAKLHERSQLEFAKNSIEGLATEWSEAVAVDSADSPEQELARLEAVSVADVNRVKRAYLDLDHAVVAHLTPHPSGQPKTDSRFGGQETISLGEPKATQLPLWARSALAKLQVPPSHVQPIVSRLPNGLTLIVQPENVSDSVAVLGHIRNRPELQVPPGQEGLSLVLDPLFAYGTEKLDRLAFQRALDEIGAQASAGTDFSVQVLSDHFEDAVALLADNELHPAFPQQAFEIVRQQVKDQVTGRLQSPGYLARRAAQHALVPAGDPTLREALPKTIEALTLADLRKYYQDAFRPDLTAIVVIGNVTPERARAVIERAFGGWHATGDPPSTILPRVPPSRASMHTVPDASRVQDEVTLVESLPLTRSDPDVYALRLGNAVLGGGFYSTRLSRDLRKNAGLVYSIDSGFELEQSRGLFLTAYACDPINVSKVQASVRRELEAMRKAPPTGDELQRAKAMLLRHTQLAEASTNGIAVGLLDRWRLGLPFDEPTVAAKRYLDLTAEEVRAAFAKWVRPEDLARVSVGPPPH